MRWTAAAVVGGAALAALACGSGPGLEPVEVPDPVPSPAVADSLAALEGRWIAVEDHGAGPVLPCTPHPPFVEIRSDGTGAFELVAGTSDGLVILTISGATATPEGLALTTEGGPGDPAQVHLVWTEPKAYARFGDLPALAGATFAAPSAAGAVPAGACPP